MIYSRFINFVCHGAQDWVKGKENFPTEVNKASLLLMVLLLFYYVKALHYFFKSCKCTRDFLDVFQCTSSHMDLCFSFIKHLTSTALWKKEKYFLPRTRFKLQGHVYMSAQLRKLIYGKVNDE